MYIFFYDIITLGVDNMFFIGGISNEEKKLDYVQNTTCPKCGKNYKFIQKDSKLIQ